ncbi:unnamed protein product, partial [Meganyctiphanes norvegica]
MLFKSVHNVDPTWECKKPEKYPLHVAARKGYYQIVNSLLAKMNSLDKLNVGLKQTNIWGNTIFHILIKSLSKSKKNEKPNQSDYDFYYKSMEVLMQYKDSFRDNLIIEEDYSLICDASKENLCDFVKLLLQQGGANPLNYFRKRDKRNPLQLACSNGNCNVVELLINHIEQKETDGKKMLKEFLNYKDKWGNTALHIILSGKDKKIKEKNDKSNAVNENVKCDPENKRGVEETGLDTEDNYLTCMKLILSRKDHIEIDAVNIVGNTALHKATKLFNDQRFAKLLIDNGARMDIKNKRGLLAELFHCNKKTEDMTKNTTDQILEIPKRHMNSIHTLIKSISDEKIVTNDIEKNTNSLKEALINGHYLEVKKVFENVIEKKLKISDTLIRNFLDIIVEGQSYENTQKLPHSTTMNNNQKKEVKNKNKCKGNNNVDFSECIDVVLNYNQYFCSNSEVIIDQVLFTVCDKGIFNLVEPLLRYGANYIRPISKNHKSSSLQIAFKKGYHLIARKLLESDCSLQFQGDSWVKGVLENIIIGFKEKNGIQYRGSNKKTKKERRDERKRKKKDENENAINYQKCFEIFLEPNIKFHNYEIKSDQDLFYKICFNGLDELAKCLIDHNADSCVEFEGKEKSPIHIASRYGYHELVDLLLDKMKDRGVEKLKQGLQMTNKWENLTIHNIVRSVTK